MNEEKYIGWIPVVSGNLSFNEIGNTNLVKNFSKINEVDSINGIQTIALFGERKLNDGILHSALRRIFGTETKYKFGFISHTESKASQKRANIRGIIYFTDNPNVEKTLLDFVDGNKGNVSALNKAFRSVQKQIEIIRWAIVNISRNGKCELIFPCNDGTDNGFIAQQFYFFLKDACHHHYHHNSKSDSITRVYKCTDSEEHNWRFETVYALHRSIVAARRYNSEDQLRKAIGITAYARTFEKKFLSEDENGGRNTEYINDHGFEPYRFEEAISSLSVMLEETRKRSSDLIANIILFITIFISILAICISFSQIDKFSSIEMNSYMVEFANLAIQHPFGLSILFSSIAVCIQMLILHGSPISNIAFAAPKEIIGRIVFLPKIAATLLLLLVSYGLFYLSYILMKHLFN